MLKFAQLATSVKSRYRAADPMLPNPLITNGNRRALGDEWQRPSKGRLGDGHSGETVVRSPPVCRKTVALFSLKTVALFSFHLGPSLPRRDNASRVNGRMLEACERGGASSVLPFHRPPAHAERTVECLKLANRNMSCVASNTSHSGRNAAVRRHFERCWLKHRVDSGGRIAAGDGEDCRACR